MPLLALLKRQDTGPELASAILRTLTVLVTESEANQEHVRQAGGLSSIVKYLDIRIGTNAVKAAVMCITGPFFRLTS